MNKKRPFGKSAWATRIVNASWSASDSKNRRPIATAAWYFCAKKSESCTLAPLHPFTPSRDHWKPLPKLAQQGRRTVDGPYPQSRFLENPRDGKASTTSQFDHRCALRQSASPLLNNAGSDFRNVSALQEGLCVNLIPLNRIHQRVSPHAVLQGRLTTSWVTQQG